MDCDAKTALVTGGAAGIGAGIAQRLAAAGMPGRLLPLVDWQSALSGSRHQDRADC